MANYDDLVEQQKTVDGKYIELVLPDLLPDTEYGFTFSWVYEDPSLGINGKSLPSDVFNVTTVASPDLLAPKFTSEDLYAINSTLYIGWSGKNILNLEYDPISFKRVNIWIKGGDFGEEYIQLGNSFTKAGQIQITSTVKSTYCVKLQAEDNSGLVSDFSDEFCVTLLKQPKAVYDVRHEWDAAGNVSLYWKFDPTLKDANNDNTLADSFGVQLLDSINDVDATWWTSVVKDKIPPLEQKITISANQLQKVFGQFTAYEIGYDVAIYVRDKNLQTSLVTGYSLSQYSDPLTAPVITATTAPMAYQISYTSNSAFDQIYVEESLDNTTWTLVAVSPANPVLILSLIHI